jgi:hypothetical protein
METPEEAYSRLVRIWPDIVNEIRKVQTSECHLQTIIYYVLRSKGMRMEEIGIETEIDFDFSGKAGIKPKSPEMRKRMEERERKHPTKKEYTYDPIPDIMFYKSSFNCDWRRASAYNDNPENVLRNALLGIEIKCAEEPGYLNKNMSRIKEDIKKISDLSKESRSSQGRFMPCMIIIDTSRKINRSTKKLNPQETDDMLTEKHLEQIKDFAKQMNVRLFYVSQEKDFYQ